MVKIEPWHLTEVILSICKEFALDFQKQNEDWADAKISAMVLSSLTEVMANIIVQTTYSVEGRNCLLEDVMSAITKYPGWNKDE